MLPHSELITFICSIWIYIYNIANRIYFTIAVSMNVGVFMNVSLLQTTYIFPQTYTTMMGLCFNVSVWFSCIIWVIYVWVAYIGSSGCLKKFILVLNDLRYLWRHTRRSWTVIDIGFGLPIESFGPLPMIR